MNVNPIALLLVGICALMGYLLGSVFVGLLIGLLIVLLATVFDHV